MNNGGGAQRQVYDRGLLLHGSKRNEVLTLGEVQQYGIDSFADPDYISLYGMTPTEWYARGIRLLGRTAVECTSDSLGDRIRPCFGRNCCLSPGFANHGIWIYRI